jgi:hypothetical protein
MHKAVGVAEKTPAGYSIDSLLWLCVFGGLLLVAPFVIEF